MTGVNCTSTSPALSWIPARCPGKDHLHLRLPDPHGIGSQLELTRDRGLAAELLGDHLPVLLVHFLDEEVLEQTREITPNATAPATAITRFNPAGQDP